MSIEPGRTLVGQPQELRAPRVLAIHHASGLGGGSLSFLDILQMLRSEFDVAALCPSEPEFLNTALDKAAISHGAVPADIPEFNHCYGGASLVSRSFWRGIFHWIRHRGAWRTWIASNRPDVVIVNSAVMAPLGPIIRRCGAKSICFVRETFPPRHRSLRTRVLFGILDRYFDGVVFLSEYDRQFSKLTRSDTEVVRDCARQENYPRVDRDEACRRLGLPLDTFNVLFVGGSAWIKGLNVALASLIHAKDPHIRLLIAGSVQSGRSSTAGSTFARRLRRRDFNSLDATVADMLEFPVVRNRVRFLGSHTNMATCYSASNAVIFPSNLPHQGRPMIEAGVYALPLVVAGYEQTREAVSNGVNGLTFVPRSGLHLGLRLDELAGDPDTAARLGENNAAKTAQEHSFDNERIRLLGFVRRVLDPRPNLR